MVARCSWGYLLTGRIGFPSLSWWCLICKASASRELWNYSSLYGGGTWVGGSLGREKVEFSVEVAAGFIILREAVRAQAVLFFE